LSFFQFHKETFPKIAPLAKIRGGKLKGTKVHFSGLNLHFEGSFDPSRSVKVRRACASAPPDDFARHAARIACGVHWGCCEVVGEGRPSVPIGGTLRGIHGRQSRRSRDGRRIDRWASSFPRYPPLRSRTSCVWGYRNTPADSERYWRNRGRASRGVAGLGSNGSENRFWTGL